MFVGTYRVRGTNVFVSSFPFVFREEEGK